MTNLDGPTPKPQGIGTLIIRFAAYCLHQKVTRGSLVIVQDTEDRYLLIRERLRERGSWSVPGGFITRDETPDECVIRELKEETGIAVAASGALKQFAHYKQPWARHYDYAYFLKVPPSEQRFRRSLEVRGCGWFMQDELPGNLTAASREAFKRFFEGNHHAALD